MKCKKTLGGSWPGLRPDPAGVLTAFLRPITGGKVADGCPLSKNPTPALDLSGLGRGLFRPRLSPPLNFQTPSELIS